MSEAWDIYDRLRRKTGRLTYRDSAVLSPDEYHIVISVWLYNQKGEWLLSRRSPNKPQPLKWAPTCGAVIAGECSLAGALREVREELGITLSPYYAKLFRTIRHDFPEWSLPGFLDVWVFPSECDLSQVVLQEGETCDAMWATPEQIRRLMDEGAFFPMDAAPYLEELWSLPSVKGAK